MPAGQAAWLKFNPALRAAKTVVVADGDIEQPAVAQAHLVGHRAVRPGSGGRPVLLVARGRLALDLGPAGAQVTRTKPNVGPPSKNEEVPVTTPQLATAPFRLVWDDFSDGFTTTGPHARWSYQSAGPRIADDGVAITSQGILRVVSGGTNPETGDPAFATTLAPEPANPAGLPGTLDHVKWLAQGTHVASTGQPGFDAIAGRELTVEMTMSARTYGTGMHPFGRHVIDAESDLRLAAAAMTWYDPQTLLVFSFFLTNEQIYAYYERLPFARKALGDYAAFNYAIPVAQRKPADWHDLAIRYDRTAGVVRWLVSGATVFQVDQLGRRLAARDHLIVDHGGRETPVLPAQLNCGMAMFTILDGSWPGTDGRGLVRISAAENYYFDPARGEPYPQRFVDEQSLAASRLFGQGAELLVSHVTVSDTPTGN